MQSGGHIHNEYKLIHVLESHLQYDVRVYKLNVVQVDNIQIGSMQQRETISNTGTNTISTEVEFANITLETTVATNFGS